MTMEEFGEWQKLHDVSREKDFAVVALDTNPRR